MDAGGGHGYHVHTFGFLVGELVRRLSGERIGAFLDREIARPLGAQLSFGLPERERSAAGRLRLRRGCRRRPPDTVEGGPPGELLRARAYLNPPGAMGVGTVNTAAWQGAEIPSANLHADARGVASVYAALAGDPALRWSRRCSPRRQGALRGTIWFSNAPRGSGSASS